MRKVWRWLLPPKLLLGETDPAEVVQSGATSEFRRSLIQGIGAKIR